MTTKQSDKPIPGALEAAREIAGVLGTTPEHDEDWLATVISRHIATSAHMRTESLVLEELGRVRLMQEWLDSGYQEELAGVEHALAWVIEESDVEPPTSAIEQCVRLDKPK